MELTDLLYYRQLPTLHILHYRILNYDEQFKMLKYNNMFTQTYVYYSEGKSNLNNKNKIDNTKLKIKLWYIYSFIIHLIYSV
jgi:hypothetical protein